LSLFGDPDVAIRFEHGDFTAPRVRFVEARTSRRDRLRARPTYSRRTGLRTPILDLHPIPEARAGGDPWRVHRWADVERCVATREQLPDVVPPTGDASQAGPRPATSG